MPDAATAVILCAGAATRMRPLSLTCPKALLPFCGRPLLEYTLAQLEESEVSEAVIVAGPCQVGFERYGSNGDGGRMKIRVVRYGGALGTGGILKHFVESTGVSGGPVLAIYGDSLLQMDFAGILQSHRDRQNEGCRATIVWHLPDDLIRPGKTRTNYGILWLTGEGRCIRFAEKPLVTDLSSHRASAAVYVLERDFLMELSDERPADLSIALLERFAQGAGSPIFGYHLASGYRFDIGTLHDYASAQFAALEGVIPIKNLPAGRTDLMGEEVHIGADTKLSGHNVFGNRVSIGARCQIQDCVLMDDTVVGNEVQMTGTILGRSCEVRDRVRLGSGTVLGDHCVVG